jgi:putative ABC transport system permease protein
MGDLTEELRTIIPRYGFTVARLWIWFQAAVVVGQFGVRQAWSVIDATGSELAQGAGADLRFTLRSLVKQPGFTFIVVGTLALGIGANTAIFSVFNALVLRPLPFAEPDQLVQLFEAGRPDPADNGVLVIRPGNFHDWKEQNRVFESMTGFATRRVAVSGGVSAETVVSHRVTEDFFETVRVQASAGRVFLKDDYMDASRRVVILSHRLWQRLFSADPSVIGRSIDLDLIPHQIIGVMPPEFYPTAYSTPELWTPLVFDSKLRQSRVDWLLQGIARLKPGVSLQQARSELDQLARRISAQFPVEGQPLTAAIKPMNAFVLGRQNRLFALLLAAVGLLLLTACFNIASLTMARCEQRVREFTIRTALGASRARLVRQSLTESLVLALCGGLAGTLLAYACIGPIRALLPASSQLPRLESIQIDVRVWAFGALLSVATGLLFGVIPALRSRGSTPHGQLQQSSRGNSIGSTRVSSALVVLEVSISLVLLIGAGLVVRSYTLLEQVDSGIHTPGVLTLRLRAPALKYPDATRMAALWDRVERGTASMPGVRSVALASQLPFEQTYNPWTFVKPGQQFSDTSLSQRAHIQRVTPGYFTTLGVPLLQGRVPEARESSASPSSIVINRTMAELYWPNENPIGSLITVSLTKEEHQLTIAGVVGDARLKGSATEPYPEMFWPLGRFAVDDVYLMVRSEGKPEGIAPLVRAEIDRIDRDIPIASVRSLDQVFADSLWRPRLATFLLGAFAFFALVLAAAGLVGVLSRAVQARTREFGIRIAIGAPHMSIVGLILLYGLKLTGIGMILGLILAGALTQLVSTQLYGVSAIDWPTIAAVSLLLAGVAVAACAVPAWRALRLDPITALQNE